MNWKNLSIASLFAALSFGAFAAQAQEVIQSSQYRYGEHLDIARVLAINEGSGSACGVVKSSMTYLDSMGVRQVVNYTTIGENCDRDN
jgi:hypothetical protein